MKLKFFLCIIFLILGSSLTTDLKNLKVNKEIVKSNDAKAKKMISILESIDYGSRNVAGEK